MDTNKAIAKLEEAIKLLKEAEEKKPKYWVYKTEYKRDNSALFSFDYYNRPYYEVTKREGGYEHAQIMAGFWIDTLAYDYCEALNKEVLKNRS